MRCLYSREEELAIEKQEPFLVFFTSIKYEFHPIYYCELLEFELRKQGKELTKQFCIFVNGDGDHSCPGYKVKP